ncbi:prostate tumor-overexpressed gene 1 protein-like [Temnothorax americanus]|uniref:prostate tumor-overexpressed gene 1 protein-like n=1 Tax=Temnothorax americanus TaxID=1964332 RepID=UPI0040697D2A
MEKTEYRAVIKFLHLKRKNTQEIKDELDSVYGEASPSFTTVKHWVAEYKRGRTSILDEERSERPKPLQKFNTGNVSTGIVQSQLLVPLRERQNIWRGIVELCEKAKNLRRFVPCQISANAKGGDPELKADTWPPKLIMQLIPKKLIGRAGVTYLRNSKCVVFHPSPCEALESLTKMMTAGFKEIGE